MGNFVSFLVLRPGTSQSQHCGGRLESQRKSVLLEEFRSVTIARKGRNIFEKKRNRKDELKLYIKSMTESLWMTFELC